MVGARYEKATIVLLPPEIVEIGWGRVDKKPERYGVRDLYLRNFEVDDWSGIDPSQHLGRDVMCNFAWGVTVDKFCQSVGSV